LISPGEPERITEGMKRITVVTQVAPTMGGVPAPSSRAKPCPASFHLVDFRRVDLDTD